MVSIHKQCNWTENQEVGSSLDPDITQLLLLLYNKSADVMTIETQLSQVLV